MKTATQHKTIVLGGKLFSFESPKIMGILNLTPDSFYDGGKWKSEAEILKGVEKMLGDGADIIDIGGQSTRPGSESVSETEELKRIIEPLKAIKKSFPEALVSIDTFRANVARAAIEEGACLINDVAAASFEPEILAIAAKYKVPYIALDLLVNSTVVAQGEIVLVNDRYGIRLTRVVPAAERLKQL